MNLNPYRKFFLATIGAIINFAQVVVVSEPAAIKSEEWLVGVIGLATALGVYQISNKASE